MNNLKPRRQQKDKPVEPKTTTRFVAVYKKPLFVDRPDSKIVEETQDITTATTMEQAWATVQSEGWQRWFKCNKCTDIDVKAVEDKPTPIKESKIKKETYYEMRAMSSGRSYGPIEAESDEEAKKKSHERKRKTRPPKDVRLLKIMILA